MTFIPQALADPVSRSVLFVWHDEENFLRYWADKVKTIDAPGVASHPRHIKVGDIIDWFQTGWNKTTVRAVEFTPNGADIPGWHRVGTYTFHTDMGAISTRVDGRNVIDAKLYVFQTKPNEQ